MHLYVFATDKTLLFLYVKQTAHISFQLIIYYSLWDSFNFSEQIFLPGKSK